MVRGETKIKVPPPLLSFIMIICELYVGLDVWEFRLTTKAYHPESNGLCEGQNKTIKESLVKVLDGNPRDWPNITEGISFTHRVSKHTSTKFLPFLYNLEPNLSIDVKYILADTEWSESEYHFNKGKETLEQT